MLSAGEPGGAVRMLRCRCPAGHRSSRSASWLCPWLCLRTPPAARSPGRSRREIMVDWRPRRAGSGTQSIHKPQMSWMCSPRGHRPPPGQPAGPAGARRNYHARAPAHSAAHAELRVARHGSRRALPCRCTGARTHTACCGCHCCWHPSAAHAGVCLATAGRAAACGIGAWRHGPCRLALAA